MGYACPVCETPQPDGEHLADHLAFAALTGADDHEAWLDDHVPDWADRGTAELAPAVVEDAEETEFPDVFEGAPDATDRPAAEPTRDVDEDVAAVLSEARDLTREMQEESESE